MKLTCGCRLWAEKASNNWMRSLHTDTVCPKDNDKVFNLPRNSEPHRHDDAIISERHSCREASLLPLIYISLHQHRPFRSQKPFIYKSRAHLLLLFLFKRNSPNVLLLRILSVAPPTPPTLYNLVGVMWQGWIFWVTAAWLSLLKRDKASGRIFAAIYLPLINSQILWLPVFYLLSRKLCFGTPKNATSPFVERVAWKSSRPSRFIVVKWKIFTPNEGGSDLCRKRGIWCPFSTCRVPSFEWAKL